MKVTPLAQGSGVPADSSTNQTADSGKLARAKAIAAGEAPPSGDPQVDRAQASLKKIKMKTQVSTNRHESPEVLEGLLDAKEQVMAPGTGTPDAIIPTPDVSEPAQAEETKPLSPQFAALARHKRALQVKERELAQREEALKTQSPAGNEDLMAKLKANPLEVLQGAGVTYDQLTEAILAQQSAPIDSQKLRSEIKEDLKKELLGEFGTRDQQAEAQVLADIKREALQITSQGEEFEAIREARAQSTVVDLIHRTWKQTGEILDTQEAALLVENQLIEEALPFARIKKIQSRLTPAQEAIVAQTPTPQKQGTKIMRTLTNRDNASPIMDRRQRAIMAMQGTLKKG